mmetsp:Transcript_23763/g.57600  ORF Transcript_23763/g.57600 Transcript_23763/m.57600 type:complete len:201 (-) Transcript_23763:862-1464(-)
MSGSRKSSERSSKASSLETVFSFSQRGSMRIASCLSSASEKSTARRNRVIVFFIVVSRRRNFHRSSWSCAFTSLICNGSLIKRPKAALSLAFGFAWNHVVCCPKLFASFWNFSSTGLVFSIPRSCTATSLLLLFSGSRGASVDPIESLNPWLTGSAAAECHATTGYGNSGREMVRTGCENFVLSPRSFRVNVEMLEGLWG